MKPLRTFLVIALFAVCRADAQDQAVGLLTATTNDSPLSSSPSRSALVTGGSLPLREDLVEGQAFRLNDPLLRPPATNSESMRFSLQSGRSVTLFPARTPKAEPERVGNLSTRAWTTVAGWRPGASAFPNPATHEPELNLVSVNRTPRP